MKKVIIKNKQGLQTHGAKMEDPTEWIAKQVAGNSWGLPERWVMDNPPWSEVSDEEKAEALDSREVVIQPYLAEHQVEQPIYDPQTMQPTGQTETVTVPEQLEIKKWEYRLPATYTVEIEDITVEHSLELLREEVKKDKHFCDEAIVNIHILNKSKGLTKGQRKQFIKDMIDIINELKVGSPDLAYDSIQALAPTSTVTQDDIDMISAKFAAYLGV